MNTPDPRQPKFRALPRPVAIAAVAAAAAIAITTALAFLLAPDAHALYAEGGPIEIVQAALLVAAGLVALARAIASRAWRHRFWRLWLAVVAALAFAREMDLHTRLNPESLGDLGVRYRLDWWTDPAVPAWLKLMWAAIALAIAAGVVAPLLAARPRPARALLAGRGHALLLLAALAFYGFGYLADDILGRGQFVSVPLSQTVEELSEMTGGFFFLLGCAANLPPTARKPKPEK